MGSVRDWAAAAGARVLLVGCLLALPMPALRAETLVVLGDEAYAPVIYLQGARPQGFLVDILRKLERYTGDQYDVQLMPWKRAYEMALRGQGALIGVSYTSERAASFDFSRPIYDDDIQLVTLKGHEFAFNDLGDLQGKHIGGVTGASYGEVVDRAIQQGLIQVERDYGQTSRLRKLLAGRLDAAIIGNGARGLEAVLRSHPELLAHREEFVALPRPLARDTLHLAVAKRLRKTDAIARFDAALESLRKENSPAAK